MKDRLNEITDLCDEALQELMQAWEAKDVGKIVVIHSRLVADLSSLMNAAIEQALDEKRADPNLLGATPYWQSSGDPIGGV